MFHWNIEVKQFFSSIESDWIFKKFYLSIRMSFSQQKVLLTRACLFLNSPFFFVKNFTIWMNNLIQNWLKNCKLNFIYCFSFVDFIYLTNFIKQIYFICWFSWYDPTLWIIYDIIVILSNYAKNILSVLGIKLLFWLFYALPITQTWASNIKIISNLRILNKRYLNNCIL